MIVLLLLIGMFADQEGSWPSDVIASELQQGRFARAIDLAEAAMQEKGSGSLPALLVVPILSAYHATFRSGDGADLVEQLCKRRPLDESTAKIAAKLFSEAGRMRGWGELLDRELAKAPAAILWVERARVHFSLQEYPPTIAALDRLSGEDARTAGVHFLRGAALAGLGRWQDAEESLARCLALSPLHHRALLELGRVQMRRKRVDDAIATFRRSIVGRPKDRAAVLFNLGQALRRVGQMDEAQFVLRAFKDANTRAERYKDLTEAVRINPERADVYENLAEFLIGEPSRRREAESIIARGLEKAPNSSRLLIAKGRLLRPVDLGAAKDAFVAALAADKFAHDARLELAEISLSAGAVKSADRFLSRSKGHVDASRWNLAYAEFEVRRGGGYGPASTYARRAVESDLTHLEAVLAWVDLGLALQQVESTLEALVAWQAAHPDNPRFPIARAVLHIERGQFERAAKILAHAMMLDGYFPPTHHFLAECHRRQRQETEARSVRERAQYLSRCLGE